MVHDSKYVTFWKRQNYGNHKNQCLPGIRGTKGRMDRQNTWDFQDSEILCMIPRGWMLVIIYLLKLIDCTTLKVSHNVNQVLLVTMMCQCRSSVLQMYHSTGG